MALLLAITALFLSISGSFGGATIERIITEYNDVVEGVPLDFSYNETWTSGNGLNSVPGCPKSEKGYPWVYFGSLSNAKCYLAGQRGPCPVGQSIFIEKANAFGFCNCNCFEGVKRKGDEETLFCNDNYGSQFAFISESKKCYELFDQAFCKENEWLIKVEENPKSLNTRPGTRCDIRKCPQPQYLVSEVNSTTKETTETCKYPFGGYNFASGVDPHNCEKEDEKYSELLKKCVKKFNFNF